MSEQLTDIETRRRLRTSAQRIVYLLVACAESEVLDAAIKVMESDIAKFRKEER